MGFALTKMERVHQLVAAGNLHAVTDDFWRQHWGHIASAKVPLETKVITYRALNHCGLADINEIFYTKDLYTMLRADREFVAALDLNVGTAYRCRVCIIWIDDDVATLVGMQQEDDTYDPATGYSYSLSYSLRNVFMKFDAPRCMRFLLQDKAFREATIQEQMSPLVQQLVEELVQPMDCLDRQALLENAQSVKLLEMCVNDEDLVAEWLSRFTQRPFIGRSYPSIMLARKLHALATPDQRARIKTYVSQMSTLEADLTDGCFELMWLCGLLGPSYPKVQKLFRKNNVGLFPACIFAMIVAMCDGYLVATRPKMLASQRRFFVLVARLPMDLQALVSLRLYGHASTVIQCENFDRAFLAII
jgi:hypothetical protein